MKAFKIVIWSHHDYIDFSGSTRFGAAEVARIVSRTFLNVMRKSRNAWSLVLAISCLFLIILASTSPLLIRIHGSSGLSSSKVVATLIATINVGGNPNGMAYDSDNGELYVADSGSSTASNIVSVIEGATNKFLTNITVGKEPYGVAFNPTNGHI